MIGRIKTKSMIFIISMIMMIVAGFIPAYAETEQSTGSNESYYSSEEFIEEDSSEDMDEEEEYTDILDEKGVMEDALSFSDDELSEEEYVEENDTEEIENLGAAVIKSGSCGDDLTYELTELDNGERCLEISGTGKMENYSTYTAAPWLDSWYDYKITTIIVGEGVTNIGKYAFFYCRGLTEITIPDSVTSIEESAFESCRGLTEITIPDSVTSIGKCAFRWCNELTEITIPDSVTSIGESAFTGCWGLTEITIPDSVTSIGKNVFYNCRGLTEITIPDSVTSIGESAFSGCSGLSEITIPEGVTRIESGTFSGCSGLSGITIPDSVTSIGESAFDSCSGLTEITIPDSVTSIGESAFKYCSGLTEITIPDSVTSIGKSAFESCNKLTEITIPASYQVNSKIFGSQTSLKRIYITKGTGTMCDYDATTCTYTPWYNSKDASIEIEEGITNIGAYAFCGCSGLSGITIPNSVTRIGNYAFSGCSGLTGKLCISTKMYIGENAFSNCSGLTELSIPVSFEVKTNLFGSQTSLKKITITKGSGKMSDYYYEDYQHERYTYYKYTPWYNSKDVSIEIEEGITNIGAYAFCGCSGISEITIPESVTSIGLSAFSGCSGLSEITIPESVTRIESGTFYGCSGLSGITIPEGVTSIESKVFGECSGLAEITIPTRVKSIGYMAFYECSGLTKIAIPEGVTSIESDAFSGCSGLSEITIPDSVTSIGSYPFNRCSGLKEITIPASLKTSYNAGFSETIEKITITKGTGTMCDYDTKTCTYTPWYNSKVANVVIEDGVTNIGKYAFYNCKGIKKLSIPGSLAITNESSFSGVDGIESLTILKGSSAACNYTPETYTYTPWYSSRANSIDVMVESGLRNIGDYYFYKCIGLNSVLLPGSVKLIGTNAFAGTLFDGMKLDEFVTSVGVSFDANGGTVIDGKKTVIYGNKYGEMPVPERRGYSFEGWYTDAVGGKEIKADDDVMIGRDITLYAHWIELGRCAVAFDTNGGRVDGLREVDFPITQTFESLPTPVRNGYDFLGWFDQKQGGVEITNLSIVPDSTEMTLYARWNPKTITVVFDAMGGTVAISKKEVQYDENYGSLPIPERKYCRFEGWFDAPKGGNQVKESTIVKSDKAITLYAHWVELIYEPVSEISNNDNEAEYRITLVKGNKLIDLKNLLKKERVDGRGYYATTTNKRIATISSKGIVVAKNDGTCQITVYKPGISKKYTLNVTVATPSFAQRTYTVNVPETVDLGFSGTKLSVSYSISAKQQKYATVNADGVVTAKAKGAVTVIATVNGKNYKTKVYVYDPELIGNDIVRVRKKLKLSVKNGAKKTSWSVEAGTGSASITQKGILIGITPGTVTVRAVNNGKEMTKEIIITE